MKMRILAWMMTPAIIIGFAAPASAAPTRTQTIPYNFHSIGQGDVGGFCLSHDSTPPVPPQFHSCIEVAPNPGEDHVYVTVVDNNGEPVYFSVRQDGNPEVSRGCGDILFPINDWGDIVVLPWAGPGANPGFNPTGVSPCAPGSVSTGGGSATLVWHDNEPSGGGFSVTKRYNFPTIGQGDVGGVCFYDDPNSPIPPQLASCIELISPLGYSSVDITVIDNSGNPVYFSVGQDGNANSATGCGAIHDLPIYQGPGGTPGGPNSVFVYHGLALNPGSHGIRPCVPGGLDPTGGTVTFTFH